jgi:hypothetical protein
MPKVPNHRNRKTANGPSLSIIKCDSTGCDKVYSDSCPACSLGFCQEHFQGHACVQSTSAAAASSDWTTTSNPSATQLRRKQKHCNDPQRRIVIYISMKHGASYAAKLYGVSIDSINRWKKKMPGCVVVPAAAAQRPDTLSPRPLAEIFNLQPEEQSSQENKAVFDYHYHEDIGSFTTMEVYQVELPPEDHLDSGSSSEDRDGVDDDSYWDRVFDGTITGESQWSREYDSQYLNMAFDRDLPEHLRVHVEASLTAALDSNTQCRAANTNAAWEPKKKSFVVIY